MVNPSHAGDPLALLREYSRKGATGQNLHKVKMKDNKVEFEPLDSAAAVGPKVSFDRKTKTAYR